MRYIVGIDLGTTNTCVSYIDTSGDFLNVNNFFIPQIVSQGTIDSQSSLPSFCYIANEGDFPEGTLNLPWSKQKKYAIGAFALECGSMTPTGLVSSAKSWLCHRSMNQKEAILPLDYREASMRISPVEASRRYLDHIRQAWNYEIAKGNTELELEQQEIILTVPASFNEVARSLTAEAAKLAGFEHITFLEEPQAAFYHWIAQNESHWHSIFNDGDTILVCDVGGGTTDFSLIGFSVKEGIPSLTRLAVGDHLLLGGDNIDAALAHYMEKKLENEQELDSIQWKRLYHEARKAKEALLSEKKQSYRAILHGKGSGIVSGTISVELNREEVILFLTEGFFPYLPWEEAQKIKKTSGIRAVGLAYEDDPCITKQLAHFLSLSHCAKPKFLLFNGGTMKAAPFQNAIKSSLETWFPETPIEVISAKNSDSAVSRGAAYFGKVRRGQGVKIYAGSPRNFYLEFTDEQQKKALCLISRGAEEGTVYCPTQVFTAKANQPVSFALYASHTRIADIPGEIVPLNFDEIHPMPPIFTVLHYGKKIDQNVDVTLKIEYTTLGTLQLWLESILTDHRWSLEFQLKSVTGHDNQLSLINKGRFDETFEAKAFEGVESLIEDFFQEGTTLLPSKIVEKLEIEIGYKKDEWPPSLLRKLTQRLLANHTKKKISSDHEPRWWNLVGYSLRPGFGYPLDDYRIKELWRIILSDFKFSKSEELTIQQWICLRRIAGGLNKGQQVQLYHQIAPSLINKKSEMIESKGSHAQYCNQEKLRTLASFERIDLGAKINLGRAILSQLKLGKGNSGDFWAFGRIGARELLCGLPSNVVPVDECTFWLKELIAMKGMYSMEKLQFPLIQLGKKISHKELDIPSKLRQEVLSLLSEMPNISHIKQIIEGFEVATCKDRDIIFGDKLPVGLEIKSQLR